MQKQELVILSCHPSSVCPCVVPCSPTQSIWDWVPAGDRGGGAGDCAVSRWHAPPLCWEQVGDFSKFQGTYSSHSGTQDCDGILGFLRVSRNCSIVGHGKSYQTLPFSLQDVLFLPNMCTMKVTWCQKQEMYYCAGAEGEGTPAVPCFF